MAVAIGSGAGCGREEHAAPSVPTSGRQTPAPEPEVAAVAQEPEPVAVAADASAAPPEDASAAGTAADGGAAEAEVVLPEPVRRFEQALKAIEQCERLPDSIRLADQGACLAPVRAARDAIRSPAPVDGEVPAPETVAAWREAMAGVLLRALDDPNPTVVLYALMQNQPDFGRDAQTLARLQELVASADPDIAEWAMTVRLWQRDPGDEAGRLLAESVLESHRFDRVRLVACQYLGDPMFREREGMFDLLRERVDDGNDTELIRNCALTRMGYVGHEEDIDVIAAHLDTPTQQSGAVLALQRGLAKAKAHKAYLKWFEQHANRAGSLQWTAVANLAPPAPGVADYPVAEGTRVLTKILLAKAQPVQVRTAAVKALERLGATAALRGALGRIERGDAGTEVRAAVEQALGAETKTP
ncbi:MAG: hypothetical protein H6744_08055 [Deltaproteobacteria bacterium]|nr:hypothetical protein [Deltaproteobacteria bacterium]MCB9786633.1 hypothetical protein [Deltaproteobacteria bacterium]